MIPIVFGIDRSYILQVFTVMHSILKHTKAEVHFIILSKDEIEKYAYEFVDILGKAYGNFTFEVRSVQEEVFDDAQIYHKHLSRSSYYRLLIPELVREYDKCIYLDSDILVNGDMQELFDVNIEDYYLAGVRDCHLIFGTDDFVFLNEHVKKNMPSVETYVNAGVLVMNLHKLRHDNMTDVFLLQAKQRNPYEDQDVINQCCHKAIKTLPLKFNMYQHYAGDEIEIAGDMPVILHLISKYKPWMNRKYRNSDRWWEMAELFSDSQFYRSAFQRCRKTGADLLEMKQIFQICSERKKVMLWGFTDQGRDVCDIFLKRGISPYAFCDNDKRKQGEAYKGISVLNFHSVMGEEETAWVVTCKNAYGEICRQLMEAGVKEADIFHFAYNSRDLEEYFLINPRYYEEEIQIIALCENDKAKKTDEEFLSCIREVIKREDDDNEMYRYLYNKYRFDLWLKS